MSPPPLKWGRYRPSNGPPGQTHPRYKCRQADLNSWGYKVFGNIGLRNSPGGGRVSNVSSRTILRKIFFKFSKIIGYESDNALLEVDNSVLTSALYLSGLKIKEVPLLMKGIRNLWNIRTKENYLTSRKDISDTVSENERKTLIFSHVFQSVGKYMYFFLTFFQKCRKQYLSFFSASHLYALWYIRNTYNVIIHTPPRGFLFDWHGLILKTHVVVRI